MKKNQQNLLPVGFYDLLFDEAEENHKKINLAIDYFLNCNYRLIKTPLVEFADNFQDTNYFLLSDVISGKNMALRNDITLQISRLLNSRLRNEELPLRLCYVGDVLLTKSNELYADRQSTQLGIEIIGCDKDQSNLEIIYIILQILPQILPKELLIEISLPNFLEILCQDL
ncbi:MAG TPA: ATP phosphoribosyltransferase regulatory subunit, partial [Rickettsiales bacterium]|nr:ATP phosphoribosyltransferase regulatory subunit [Rickettsiales bacterium]